MTPGRIALLCSLVMGCGAPEDPGQWDPDALGPATDDCDRGLQFTFPQTNAISTDSVFVFLSEFDPSIQVDLYTTDPIPGTGEWVSEPQSYYRWVPDEPLPGNANIDVEVRTCDGTDLAQKSFVTRAPDAVDPNALEGLVLGTDPASPALVMAPGNEVVLDLFPLQTEGLPGSIPLGTLGSPLLQIQQEDGGFTGRLALAGVPAPPDPGSQDLCEPSRTLSVSFDNPALHIGPFDWPVQLPPPLGGPVYDFTLEAVAYDPPENAAYDPPIELRDVQLRYRVPVPSPETCDDPAYTCAPCGAGQTCFDVHIRGLVMYARAVPALVHRTPTAIASDPECP